MVSGTVKLHCPFHHSAGIRARGVLVKGVGFETSSYLTRGLAVRDFVGPGRRWGRQAEREDRQDDESEDGC